MSGLDSSLEIDGLSAASPTYSFQSDKYSQSNFWVFLTNGLPLQAFSSWISHIIFAVWNFDVLLLLYHHLRGTARQHISTSSGIVRGALYTHGQRQTMGYVVKPCLKLKIWVFGGEFGISFELRAITACSWPVSVGSFGTKDYTYQRSKSCIAISISSRVSEIEVVCCILAKL